MSRHSLGEGGLKKERPTSNSKTSMAMPSVMSRRSFSRFDKLKALSLSMGEGGSLARRAVFPFARIVIERGINDPD
jgi:hypothetical protein